MSPASMAALVLLAGSTGVPSPLRDQARNPADDASLAVPESVVAPFVPPSGSGSMPAPYTPGARQFLVQPGQAWQHLVAEFRPGDEVLLPSGFHLPQVIVGLRGSVRNPIYIRSRDRVQAAIACGGDGFVLRDAEHVVLENVLFLNPVHAALTVDSSRPGSPRPAGVELRRCSVRGTKGDAAQDAIRVRDVSGVRVTDARVEDWNDAAVELERCVGVRISRLLTAGEGRASRARGVSVRAGTRDVEVIESAFNGTVGAGVEVGSAAGSPAGEVGDPPRNVRIKGCIFNAPGTALRVGAADGLLLVRSTIYEPTGSMFDLPGGGPVSRVRIAECIGTWTTGALSRFSPHGAGVPASAITLGDNVWYSRELPEAWAAIGRPFGLEQVPQRTDLDPLIDPQTLRARNPAVAGFGAFDTEAAVPAMPPRAP